MAAEQTSSRRLQPAIERPRKLSAAQRAQFIRIFEASFPPGERDSGDKVLDSIEREERLCYLAELPREVAALAVLLRLRDRAADVLEYLAVDTERRSGGLGGLLLGHVRSDLSRMRPASRGIIFEVEDPNQEHGPERDLRRRRIAFYERNGAALVECAPDYRAPSLAGEGEIRFRLMWLPFDESSRHPTGVLLRRCVRGILTESYGLDERAEIVETVLSSLIC